MPRHRTPTACRRWCTGDGAVDEWKYWTMGWPLAETVVINRARVDAPEPWKSAAPAAL